MDEDQMGYLKSTVLSSYNFMDRMMLTMLLRSGCSSSAELIYVQCAPPCGVQVGSELMP